MPENKVNIEIRAKNNTKAAFKSTGKGLDNLTKSAKRLAKIVGVGLVAAFAGLVAIGKKSIDKFLIQEKALARLDATTTNVLVSFKGLKKGTEEFDTELARSTKLLTDQASALQKVTTFGDEEIISAQALAGTFALDAEAIEQLIPRILDMAASLEKAGGTGADLESITIAIGKSMTTGVGALSRYGVVISDTAKAAFNLADEQGKLDIITQELDKNFKGIAETIGLTAAGKIKQMQNAMGDLQEQIGSALAEALVPFIQQITEWSQNPDTQQKFKEIAEAAGRFLTNVLPKLITGVSNIILIFKEWKSWFDNIADALGTAISKVLIFIDKIKRMIAIVRQAKETAIGFLTGGAGGIAGVPFFQQGGVMPQTGLAFLHKGETVIPAGAGVGAGLTINITGNTLLDADAGEKIGNQIVNLLKLNERL